MKPFKLSDFTKAMLAVKGRKPTEASMREILATHVIYLLRFDKTKSESEIYSEIKKVLELPIDKLERKFNKAMKD